jgi:anti-sigma regulatory factor (Ser/Thr protein kinase)
VSSTVRERTWSMAVPHHAGGARMARQRLAAELTDRVPAPLLADAVAVVGELLGNAVRHAQPLPGGVIRVAWRVGGGTGRSMAGTYVVLRVTDGGAEDTPQTRVVGPDSVDGRGLAIVEALAVRWGVERDGAGQCVWARVEASAS